MPKNTADPDPRIKRAVEMAEQDASLSDIAEEFGVSTRTASRLVRAGGARVRIPGGKKIGKKPQYLQRVLDMHDGGSTVGEIVTEIGDLHSSTVAAWLKEESRTPRYDGFVRAAKDSEDHEHKAEALRRYMEGETARAVSADLGLSERTVEWWAKQEGLWGQGGVQKRQADCAQDAVRRYRDGESVSAIVASSHLDHYQVRMALDESGDLPFPENERPNVVCPCGKKTGSPNRKYCSPGCRMEYGKKKQANPENHRTFNCENCGKEVTRYKKLNYHKYCSNACANKHTKTKKHIVVDDAVVLDSGYEAFFWGLCQLFKLPVERFDRKHGVEWREGCWYAPDFYLPTLDLAVELKGLEDASDKDRWALFEKEQGRLVILTGDDLRGMFLGKSDFIATVTKA